VSFTCDRGRSASPLSHRPPCGVLLRKRLSVRGHLKAGDVVLRGLTVARVLRLFTRVPRPGNSVMERRSRRRARVATTGHRGQLIAFLTMLTGARHWPGRIRNSHTAKAEQHGTYDHSARKETSHVVLLRGIGGEHMGALTNYGRPPEMDLLNVGTGAPSVRPRQASGEGERSGHLY
jgi:hypothetical protein